MEGMMLIPDDTAEDMLECETEEFQGGRFLTFSIGESEYGIPVDNVCEIIGIQKVADWADAPDMASGFVDLQGNFVPVIDVREYLIPGEHANDDRTCVIVVKVREATFGLIVDSLSEVVNITSIVHEPPLYEGFSDETGWISGTGYAGDQEIRLLDLDQFTLDVELEPWESCRRETNLLLFEEA
jgi:purine-binding chemotaxis protein CheW